LRAVTADFFSQNEKAATARVGESERKNGAFGVAFRELWLILQALSKLSGADCWDG